MNRPTDDHAAELVADLRNLAADVILQDLVLVAEANRQDDTEPITAILARLDPAEAPRLLLAAVGTLLRANQDHTNQPR